jgi:hypothetical protein
MIAMNSSDNLIINTIESFKIEMIPGHYFKFPVAGLVLTSNENLEESSNTLLGLLIKYRRFELLDYILNNN